MLEGEEIEGEGVESGGRRTQGGIGREGKSKGRGRGRGSPVAKSSKNGKSTRRGSVERGEV